MYPLENSLEKQFKNAENQEEMQKFYAQAKREGKCFFHSIKMPKI